MMLLLFSLTATAQSIDTLYVNEKTTLHLQCSSDIVYCDLGNKCINAAIAPGVPYLLRIKATSVFDGITNLSVLTKDDSFTTYAIKYTDNLTTYIVRQAEQKTAAQHNDTLVQINKLRPALNHIFDRVLKVDFNINSIYTANDKIYITLSIKNRSAINYSADATYTISDIKRNRNTAQDIVLTPIEQLGKITAPALKESVTTYVFDRLAISDGKEIQVNIYETDGGYRNVTLHIDAKDIANAKIYR